VATAAENVAKAKKNLDALAKRARVAECSATASAAESRALFSGDATSLKLTKKGRLLAAKVQAESAWEHETKVKRLMRHVTSEAKAREKAKDLAKIASDKAEKPTLQCLFLSNFDYMWLKMGAYLNLSATGVCSRVPLPFFVQPKDSYSGTY